MTHGQPQTTFAGGVSPFPTANNPFPSRKHIRITLKEPTMIAKQAPAKPAKASKSPADEDYSTTYTPPIAGGEAAAAIQQEPCAPSPMEILRQSLLDTLKDLRNRESPMDIERAKAVATVATVLVDTAKVENDYLRITGHDRSQFIGGQALLA